MSYSTQPCFVHYGNWDDQTQSHPAMAWMENYTRNVIDDRKWEKGMAATEAHASDMQLQKADGTVIKGAEEAWKALAEIYGPFAAHKHVPNFLVCYESNNGWEMIGLADVYFKLHGLGGDAVTDPEGDKWDGYATGAFKFTYVKDGDAIKLKESRIFSDPTPAMRIMLKNKMVNGDQLAGIVIGS